MILPIWIGVKTLDHDRAAAARSPTSSVADAIVARRGVVAETGVSFGMALCG
jgi:hypothetical protein